LFMDGTSPSEEGSDAPEPEPELTVPDRLNYVWPLGESLPPIEILIVDAP